MAAAIIGIEVSLVAVSEANPKLRQIIVDRHAPEHAFAAMAVDAGPVIGEIDIYVAGPPWQDFSMAGGRAGAAGHR